MPAAGTGGGLDRRVSNWAQLPVRYPADSDLAAGPRTRAEYRIDNLELADGRFYTRDRDFRRFDFLDVKDPLSRSC